MDDKALNQMKSHILLEWQQKAPRFIMTLILAHGLPMRVLTGDGETRTEYDMKHRGKSTREWGRGAYVVNRFQSARSAVMF